MAAVSLGLQPHNLNETNHNHDQCNHKEDVNKTSQGVGAQQAEQPQNNQDNRNRFKHIGSFEQSLFTQAAGTYQRVNACMLSKNVYLFTSWPITPPTAAPPKVPAVLPPVKMAPPIAPAPAPIAVFLSCCDIPEQPANPQRVVRTTAQNVYRWLVFMGSPPASLRRCRYAELVREPTPDRTHYADR
jgi:hypothetical protein